MSTPKELEWSDKFSTDIVSIDRQHQELLFLSQNLLSILSDENAALDDKQAAYHDLIDHAVEHFVYEERVMRNIGYPGLPHHVSEHDDLRKEITGMTELVNKGEGLESWKGLASMVQVWVLRHIVHSDTKIRKFIQRLDDDDIDADVPVGERRARP